MKRIFYIVFTIIIFISLSGCWSRKEPKKLALVNSAIYGMSSNGDYQVTIEVVNPASDDSNMGGGSGKSPSITASSEGVSFPEAVRNLSESMERTLFGGHIKVRLFSERLVQNDISGIIDYILRDNLTDENPLMVVIADEEPKRIYSSMIGLSDRVGDYIESISEEQLNATSKSVLVDTLTFAKDFYNEGKQPVTGVVRFVECDSKPSENTTVEGMNQEGTGEKHRIVYGGLAAFKDEKLAGYMNEVEARAYNFITNNIKQAVISIISEKTQTVVEVNNPKAEKTIEVLNGKITINVKIKTNISIIQENSKLDISDTDCLKTIETAFNKQMEREITEAIEKAQREFRSDIFGFGVAMHRKHPEEWKAIKSSWDDYFSEADVNVMVDSSVTRTGEIKQQVRLVEERK